MSEGATGRILGIVRQVPAGSVATYGQVARLAGLPGAARQVGYALARLDDGSDVPWQRVVRADGSIAPRRPRAAHGSIGRSSVLSSGERLQRELLEREGIQFGTDGRLALPRYRWQPER